MGIPEESFDMVIANQLFMTARIESNHKKFEAD